MRRTLSFCSIVVFTALSARNAAAQVTVAPRLMPAPPGQFIVVNNLSGADHYDPHVSGNLVVYSNSDGTNFTVRYHDLTTGIDNAIPNGGTSDFLADVSGGTIAFTRLSPSESAIFSYAVGASSAVEVNPMPGATRQAAQIGTSTVAWQEYGASIFADIVAYDVASGGTTRLTNDQLLNQEPAISPEGAVIAWMKCANPSAPCDIWSAVRTGAVWITYRITKGNGDCTHPDTNGTVVVYSCDRGTGDQLYWQAVTGGAEYHLGFSGNASTPSIAGQFIAFSGLPQNAVVHDLYVFDLSSLNLYQITNTSADEELCDISITQTGQVNVAWQVQEAELNVYAFTFNLPVDDLLTNLLNLVNSLDLSHGTTTSLDAKLQAAEAALAAQRANDLTTACNNMTAFINAVNAQSGNMLTVDQANQLLAAAQQIKAALGCP